MVLKALQAPVVDTVSCEPASPTVGQTITCTGVVSGGEPTTYAWTAIGADHAASVSRGETYTTSFSEQGRKTITFTVMNDAGAHSKSTTVTVQPLRLAPDLESISCEPAPAVVDETITCTAILSGGPPDTYSWATRDFAPGVPAGGDPAYGSDATFTTTFAFPGPRYVALQVANDYGSSLTLTFGINVEEPLQAPVIDDISCDPASPAAGDTITCSANLSGGLPDTYAWSGGGQPDSGSDATFTTTFATAGNRTITLTVANTAGSATDTLPINIADTITIVG